MSSLDFLAGGLANASSSYCLNIFESAKTRIQLDLLHLNYKTLPQTLQKIYAEEGLRGLLTPGINAGVIREMSYSSIRLGLYAPARTFFGHIFGENDAHDTSIIVKFLAGVSTGILGSSVTNPADLVRVRLQAECKSA